MGMVPSLSRLGRENTGEKFNDASVTSLCIIVSTNEIDFLADSVFSRGFVSSDQQGKANRYARALFTCITMFH